MSKAVSNREICFIKQCYYCVNMSTFFLNVENGVHPPPLQAEKKCERVKKEQEKTDKRIK